VVFDNWQAYQRIAYVSRGANIMGSWCFEEVKILTTVKIKPWKNKAARIFPQIRIWSDI
jgi:hypothetical protein